MRKFDLLIETLNNVRDDVANFEEKGNKAAGTRLRNAMQDAKNLAQEIRVDVLDANKARAKEKAK